ncbi:uncharacterized protein LOC123413854 [Hordeum vulgare subsp. vulgare]|uniref:uncharacterized protein LOC123413854 n=1 Tax=Hordeum vulgare subsp. vulgare TaxID=112509 RepID=UPI00162EB719|nr:uncharacterized protein LOC123413854 [Hordeum vulgare subsp. vulgare]XP_044962557.1 uncharacterized protein LOC123413854 [Hordeum vulgare subsp. vulgare]
MVASRPTTPFALSYGSLGSTDIRVFQLVPRRGFVNLPNLSGKMPNKLSAVFKVFRSTWEICDQSIRAKWASLSAKQKFVCQLGGIVAGFEVLLALLFYYSKAKMVARVESKFKVHQEVLNKLKHIQEVDESNSEREAAERRIEDAGERRREADEGAKFAAQQLSHMGAQIYKLQMEVAEQKIALQKMIIDRGSKGSE